MPELATLSICHADTLQSKHSTSRRSVFQLYQLEHALRVTNTGMIPNQLKMTSNLTLCKMAILSCERLTLCRRACDRRESRLP
jgi:hypothetical protein